MTRYAAFAIRDAAVVISAQAATIARLTEERDNALKALAATEREWW